MKKIVLPLLVITILSACQDQLDITHPNEPSPESATTKRGMISLAQGAVYINGLAGDGFFSGVLGAHDRMGDIIGSPYAPQYVSCPDRIILDDGAILNSINLNGQKQYLKEVNVITSKYNVLYYEWTWMYAMIGALNQALAIIDQVDANEGEKNTIKAWIYFWKGWAYSRIGSMYVAGIINNDVAITNGNYVGSMEILIEADNNLQKADDLLILLSGNDDYEEIIADLIPIICKRGKGNPPTTDQWRRNINTLRARNLLVNTPQVATNSEFWDEILTLTEDGVTAIDNTFTVRTDDLGNLLNTFVASDAIGPAEDGGGAYKISERLIQDFDAHDQRFLNNFDSVQAWIPEADRGNALGTRYVLVDEGKGIPDALVYCKKTIGEQELYIVGTYEENVLMRAEALLHKEQVNAGLALIDELRNFQGAGLTPLAGSAISSDEAKQILRRERRVALAFRGFSFYDARRWDILENGRTGAVVVDFDGKVNTNAKIEYGYQGYWDVPIAESYYNPPAEGSAPIVNLDD